MKGVDGPVGVDRPGFGNTGDDRALVVASDEAFIEFEQDIVFDDGGGFVRIERARIGADAAIPGGARDRLQYYRLHGSPRMYWSNYSLAYLRNLVRTAAGATSTLWIIFDNTAAGCGTTNALQLSALLSDAAMRRA